jgi:hypothetical protein
VSTVEVLPPFPVHFNGEKWQTYKRDGYDVPRLVDCESEQEAKALADVNVLLSLSTYRHPTPCCKVERVRRCIEALARHGDVRINSWGVRQLIEFEERLAKEGK